MGPVVTAQHPDPQHDHPHGVQRHGGAQKFAEIDEQLGEGRQLGTQIFEDPREGGNQKDGHPQEHQDGDHQHCDGITQSAFDLVLKLGVVFQQLGQSL